MKKINPYIKKKVMKSTLLVIVFLIGVTFYTLKIKKHTLRDSESEYDEVVMSIDGSKYTKEKVFKEMGMFSEINSISNNRNDIDYNTRSTIKQAIDREILYKKGVEEGIKADNKDIERHYKRISDTIYEKEGETLEEFAEENNISESDIKESIKRNIIANKYITKETSVTEDEIEKYYEKNRENYRECSYLYILIPEIEDSSDEIINDILYELKSGKNFEKTAELYTDEYKDIEWGKLGYVSDRYIKNENMDSVLNLENGEYTIEPVKNKYGSNIVMKVDSRYTPLSKVQESIKEKISYQKYFSILNHLKKEYNVIINDKYE